MVLGNTCPGFIRIPGKRAQRMMVLKSSVRLVRKNLIGMRVVKGLRSKMKRVPEKFTEEIFLDLVDVFLYPLGTKAGLENTDSIELVLTCTSDIIPDFVEKYKAMEKEKRDALAEKDRMKQRLEEFKEEIKNLETKNEKLVNKIVTISEAKN